MLHVIAIAGIIILTGTITPTVTITTVITSPEAIATPTLTVNLQEVQSLRLEPIIQQAQEAAVVEVLVAEAE